MRDLYSNIAVQQTLDPQVVKTDQESDLVDHQGYDSIDHHVAVGQSGDTLSGTVKFDLKILHGDESDGSDMAAVAATDVIGATPDTDGVFATIDADGEDGNVYCIGYIGSKRYSRIVVDATGTHTNGTPIGALAVLGHPAQAPTT
jgi:hypothetical protein